MQQMIQMRMAQPQPTGPNQSLPNQPPQEAMGGRPDLGSAAVPQMAASMGQASNPFQGNPQATMAMLQQLMQQYPKLKAAEHKNGRAQLAGPAQDQFLGAVWAKAHGAKEHHVRNDGGGQRLHVSW